MGLSKGKFIAMLAFALLWSSIECAALCATEPCTGQALPSSPTEPPCHRHHHPSNQTPASCQHQQLAQADVPQAFMTPAPHVNIAAMNVPVASYVEFPSPSGAYPLAPSAAFSPPDLAVVSSVILRI